MPTPRRGFSRSDLTSHGLGLIPRLACPRFVVAQSVGGREIGPDTAGSGSVTSVASPFPVALAERLAGFGRRLLDRARFVTLPFRDAAEHALGVGAQVRAVDLAERPQVREFGL
jgi:hypothetical protein